MRLRILICIAWLSCVTLVAAQIGMPKTRQATAETTAANNSRTANPQSPLYRSPPALIRRLPDESTRQTIPIPPPKTTWRSPYPSTGQPDAWSVGTNLNEAWHLHARPSGGGVTQQPAYQIRKLAYEDEGVDLGLPTIPDEAWLPPEPRNSVGRLRDEGLQLAPPSTPLATPAQQNESSSRPASQAAETLPTPPARPEGFGQPNGQQTTSPPFERSNESRNDDFERGAASRRNPFGNAAQDDQEWTPITLPEGASPAFDPVTNEDSQADRPERRPSEASERNPFRTKYVNEPKPFEGKKLTRDAKQELLLQSARNAIRLGQKELAIERFTEYVRLNPGDSEARLEFAGLLADAGRSQAASAQIEHLLKQNPDDLAFLRRYADMQIQLSSFAKAENALIRLVEHPEYRVDAAVDLARVFAWTSRTDDALTIYDEILRDVELVNPKRKLQFAELLTDIQRPSEALTLLLELHEATPMDLHILELIILASARTGNTNATFDYISRLASLEPENVEKRYDLANKLYEGQFYRESLLVDQQVLTFDPANKISLVRSALSNLKLFEVSAAKAMLDGVPASQADAKYQRALSEYHSVIGEHADAIAICRRVLIEDPSDLETRISLGHALHRAGQLMRSAHELGRVVEEASQTGVADGPLMAIRAQLAQATVLAEARRFDEAIAVLELAAESRGYQDAILDTYIVVLSKARRYGEAVQAVRAAIAESLGQTYRELQLRGKLGLLLARNGEYPAAIQELTAVDTFASEPSPETIYGLYQAHKMLGNREAAQIAIDQHLGVFTTDTYARVRIAELATEDCDCCLARTMLQHLEGQCFGNPLISNRLGEACFQCATCEGTCNCAGFFVKTLNQSPSNIQAMLGLARLHSRLGNYAEADCQYQKALRHLPDDPNLLREVGRMHQEANGPRGSMPYYQQALQRTSGEHLVAAAKTSPEQIAQLESEYESLAPMSSIVATEMQGKQFSGWRPLSSITTYEGVLALEPRNEDALFEIAQAYSALNRTHCAIDTYKRLLCLNPCHREANVALNRNYLELRPQVHTFTGYRSQEGRNDLATIDKFWAGSLLQFPLGEEDEFLQLGYKRIQLMPPSSPDVGGNVAIARVQWKPIWPLLLFAQGDYETYEFGFEPRVTYDLGARYRYLENATLRFHLLRDNVAQNRVTINNDIHRTGFEFGQSWQPSLPLEIDAFWRYWSYSDDNEAVEAGIHTGYKLTYGRNQFRWLTDFDYNSFEHSTIFDPSGDLDLATFPYFSPDNFWYISGGLEYRRYLGCDMFKAGDLHWFEIYGGGRVDSEGNAYALARGELLHDIHPWMTLTAYSNYVRSAVYNVWEAGAQLTIRF